MQDAQKVLRSYATVLLRKWERVIQRLNGKTKDNLPKLFDYDIVEEMGRRGDPLCPLSDADWKALYEALATFIRRLANMQDRILDENYAAMITMFQLISGSDHDSEYEGVFTKRGTWSVIRTYVLKNDPQENLHLMIFFLTLLIRRRSCSCCQATELVNHGDELCARLQRCFELSNKASPYMKFELAYCVIGLIMPCFIHAGPDPKDASGYIHTPMIGRLLVKYNLLRSCIKLLDPDQLGQFSQTFGVQDLSMFGRYLPFAIRTHKDLYPLSETKEFVNKMVRIFKRCKDAMPLLIDTLTGEMENLMHSKFFSGTFLPHLVESMPRNSLKDLYNGIASQLANSGTPASQFAMARGFYRVGRFDAHVEVAKTLFYACGHEDIVITREAWDLFHHEFAVPSLQRQYFEPLKSEVSEYIFNKRMLILEDLLVHSWKPFTAKLSNNFGRSPEIRFSAYPNPEQKYWAMITECEFETCIQCGYQTVRNGFCLRGLGCGYKGNPVGVTMHRNIALLDGQEPLTESMMSDFKSWTKEPSKSELPSASSTSVSDDHSDELEYVELGNLKMKLPRSKLLSLKEDLSYLGEMEVKEGDIIGQEMKEEYEKLLKYCEESEAKAVRKVSGRDTSGYHTTKVNFEASSNDDDDCKITVFNGVEDALQYLEADTKSKKPIKVVQVDTSSADKIASSLASLSFSSNKETKAETDRSNNSKAKASPTKAKPAAPPPVVEVEVNPATAPVVEAKKAMVEEEEDGETDVVNTNSNHSTFAMECTYCARVAEDLMLCGRCQQVRYCNRACQKADWKKSHKAECNNSNGS